MDANDDASGRSGALPTGDEAGPGDHEGDDLPVRRHRLRTAAVAAGVAVSLVALAIGLAPKGRRPDKLTAGGGPATAFHLPRLAGGGAALSLDGFRGRPLVVNFWASWCVPCRKEMPQFERAFERHGGRVAFLGVNHQDTRSDALDFVRSSGVRYPVAYDPDGRTAPTFGLVGLPGTVFISPEGRVLARHTGEISAARLEQGISDLFGDKPG